MARVVAPIPNLDDQFFWTGVEEGRLLARRCVQCGYLQHPPSPMCPKCGSVEWGVHELSGTGTVYSWIVSRHPSQPDDNPRVVAIVELAEGVRFISNLRDVDPANVHNGMSVEVTFADVEGVKLPQFRPVTGGRS